MRLGCSTRLFGRCKCGQRLHSLHQRVRLNWYQVLLHYFLGILMLEDALKVAGREDLLHRISAVGPDAESEAYDMLEFGLENTYALRGLEEVEADGRIRASVAVTLVALDPYPRHVVDTVALMHNRLRRKYGMDSHDGTYIRRLSILIRTLRQLPRSSRAVMETQDIVQSS
jgi:hypothetical protein